jgi:hypothetical protein
MVRVTVAEAKTQLSSLLDAVEAGEAVAPPSAAWTLSPSPTTPH